MVKLSKCGKMAKAVRIMAHGLKWYIWYGNTARSFM